ncbi:unnamed protein product [Clonostachys rosea f. rosea IK726]|uniref:Uncharacterized protein n=1 Tax=Clonostachys rosea f. rosea IK726 TaxID=1349383 RepID=A0ACA9TU03_BIOOC|nr:unnamed protein product [Clonostachys rosea f. rosea IK726]
MAGFKTRPNGGLERAHANSAGILQDRAMWPLAGRETHPGWTLDWVLQYDDATLHQRTNRPLDAEEWGTAMIPSR